MKTQLFSFVKKITFSFVIATFFGACQSKTTEQAEENPPISQSIVEVKTVMMDFQMKDSIPSGWNTFRYLNESNEVHFFVLEKLPSGIRLSNYENELLPVFKEGFSHLGKGNIEEGMKTFERLPEWFLGVQNHGGVGLLSGKSIGETTLNLEPGTYAMECYVRMPDGTPHVFLGMLREVIVTEENSGMEAPSADARITISSQDGIQLLDSLTAGEIQFSVEFKDQKMYEHYAGHDVNLVKLEEGSDLEHLVKWIDPSDMLALSTPEPKGFYFLGGVEDLPSGKTGYFKAMLEPGDYVLISEIPDAQNRKMVKRFAVH
ncbi:hypothetical protein [Algoriphagus sp. CAU 1675]|uniref:hypothetical protein n=1 Tax=Algoriphagus sp. CAU 1675 TaxID=3032597 RepID=UPI0023DB4847|nr:hypothetical protein [Algoriphagus sp. CAU 1675]MDF2159011.1 hypothetical protein [Algoriphagus sp. CAU 1675]